MLKQNVVKKSIILIMPKHFEIYKAFLDNLEQCGFEVKLFYASDQDFRYVNIIQKLTNFFRKTFFNDKNFKQNLKLNFDSVQLAHQFQNLNSIADYALVIRPDYFTKEALLLLKTKAKKLIGYQWDGLDRYPKAKTLITIFDKFFVFDPNDFQKYKKTHSNILLTSNFYFDIATSYNANNSKNKEVFFIGSFVENRIESILFLTKILKKLGYTINIKLLYFNEETPKKYADSGITFIKDPLTYPQVMEQIQKSDIILDFVDTVHNGLSFRFFEAIYLSKKLITNNKLSREHELYSQSNILVWDTNITPQVIENFVNADYKNLEKKDIEKYSFTTWINHILE